MRYPADAAALCERQETSAAVLLFVSCFLFLGVFLFVFLFLRVLVGNFHELPEQVPAHLAVLPGARVFLIVENDP